MKRINISMFKKGILVLLAVSVMLFTFLIFGNAQTDNVVYLRDGGVGDGKSYENAIGDFKDAVRVLAKTGGTIIICGNYTYNELIYLSEQSGTQNGKNTITVTSIYDGYDYRSNNGASLRMGDTKGSANIILAGNFIFENLNIVTAGNNKARAFICSGYDVLFGNGIVCRKTGDAPFPSVVGGFVTEKYSGNCNLNIKSGSYNYVVCGNRDSVLEGSTTLTIDGGFFEGIVSASAFENYDYSSNIQHGSTVLNINGGIFSGNIGALSNVDGDFYMNICGGTFNKDIICRGKINTVDINGGVLKNITSLKVVNYTDSANNEDADETDDIKSAVNVNVYNGDVQQFVEKIQGEGVVVNIKAGIGGGEDEESEIIITPTQPSENTDIESTTQDENGVPGDNSTENGNKALRISAIVVLCALSAVSFVLLIYRYIGRKE